MNGPSGYWYLDGLDIWNNFAIGIQDGLAQFIPLTERKESITNDWPDQDGLDVDTSSHFFKERLVTLTCWLFAESETEFWTKRDSFINQLRKPGLRRLTVKAHRGKSYFVIFKSCTNYTQVKGKALTGVPDHYIVHQFTLTLLEPGPQLDATDILIAADEGDFLVV